MIGPKACTKCQKTSHGFYKISDSWCKECYRRGARDRYNDPILREAAQVRYRRQRELNPPYSLRSGGLNRKAKRFGAPGRVTKQELEEIWARHKGLCVLRGVDCVGSASEWDHAIPLTRYGSSGASWNLIPACRRCNAQKNAMTLNEWRRECRWRMLDSSVAGWIDPLALIGSPPEDRDFVGPGIEPVIHETARIEAFCTVDAGKERATTVGANSWMMKACHAGHDVVIGDNCELAPHTVLGGGVILEDGVRCGIGVMVKPFVTVGAGARLGAGATVILNVPAGEVHAGNPARLIETRDRYIS